MLKKKSYEYLLSRWFKPKLTISTALLWPVSLFNRTIIQVRKNFLHDTEKVRNNTPVIALERFTTGDYQPTPLIISLIKFLQAQGFHPGVVVQNTASLPLEITPEGKTKPLSTNRAEDEAISEALWIGEETKAPIVVGAKGTMAMHDLLAKHSIDVVLLYNAGPETDLHADIKVLAIDVEQWFGNQHLLPAGPLYKPLTCLHEIDFIFINIPYAQGHGSLDGMEDVGLLYRKQLLFLKKFAPQSIVGFIQSMPERFRNLGNGASVSALEFDKQLVYIGTKSQACFQNLFKLSKLLGVQPKNEAPLSQYQIEQANSAAILISEKEAIEYKKEQNKQKFWALESILRIKQKKGDCIILEQLINKIKQCYA